MHKTLPPGYYPATSLIPRKAMGPFTWNTISLEGDLADSMRNLTPGRRIASKMKTAGASAELLDVPIEDEPLLLHGNLMHGDILNERVTGAPVRYRVLRTSLLLALILLLLTAADVRAQQGHEYVTVPVNVSILPGVSIGDMVAHGDERVVNNVSFTILWSRAARLRGIQFGGFYSHYTENGLGLMSTGLANRVDSEFVGLQSAGFANIVGSQMRGIQTSGLGNVTGGSLQGVQVGGFANIAGSDALGLQIAGFGNIAGAAMDGVQVAGFGNIAGAERDGVQVAGFGNIVGSGMTGVQVGGFGNIVGRSYRGVQVGGFGNLVGSSHRGVQIAGALNLVGNRAASLQVAGLGNLTGEDQSGLQVGGLFNMAGSGVRGAQIAPVNFAHTVRGVQIGVFNRASEHTGVPIGLVSYVGDVGLAYDVHADETGVFTGVRSGNRLFSNYLSIGVRPQGDPGAAIGLQAGLGVQAPASDAVSVMLDLLTTNFLPDPDDPRYNAVHSLRGAGLVRLTPRVGVFAGPRVSLYTAEVGHEALGDLAGLRFWDDTRGSFRFQGYVGFSAGLRVFGR